MRKAKQGNAAEVRKLIRLAEAAALMDVHPKTVRAWISKGRLTGYRIGANSIRVDRGELLAMAQPMATAGTV